MFLLRYLDQCLLVGGFGSTLLTLYQTTKFWTYPNSKHENYADDKINEGAELKFVLRRVENIVDKGENAGYQHFLLFPQCVQKSFFSGVIESRDRLVTGLL